MQTQTAPKSPIVAAPGAANEPDAANEPGAAIEIEPIELNDLAEYALQVPLIEETAEVRPVPLPSQERAQRKAVQKAREFPLSAVLAASVISILAVGALGLFLYRHTRHVREPEVQPAPVGKRSIAEADVEDAVDSPTKAPAAKPAPVVASPKPEAARPAHKPAARPPAVSRAEPANIDRALYAVLAVDSENKQRFRLGTAWSFAPRHLATSAAVVLGIEELQREGLRAVVAPAGESREIRVRGMRVNQQYRQAVVRANSLRQQLENPQSPPAQPPPIPPALGRGVERVGVPRPEGNDGGGQIIAPQPVAPPNAVPPRGPHQGAYPGAAVINRAQLDQAWWTQVRCDVGLLEVDEELQHVFPIPPGPAPRPGEVFLLAGLPFGLEECSWPESAPAPAAQRISAPASSGTSPAGGFFLLELPNNPDDRNWSGSPVVNEAGQVVAIYSRDTNPLEGAPRWPAAHAVVSTQLLREIAADLMK